MNLMSSGTQVPRKVNGINYEYQTLWKMYVNMPKKHVNGHSILNFEREKN